MDEAIREAVKRANSRIHESMERTIKKKNKFIEVFEHEKQIQTFDQGV